MKSKLFKTLSVSLICVMNCNTICFLSACQKPHVNPPVPPPPIPPEPQEQIIVQFDLNGGSWEGSTDPIEIILNKPTTFDQIQNKPEPEYDDFDFVCWTNDDGDEMVDQLIEYNMVVKAQWEKKPEPEPEKTITYPETHYYSVELNQGSGSILIPNFAYSGFEIKNPDNLFISIQGLRDYEHDSDSLISITPIIYQASSTFDLKIDFKDAKPVDYPIQTLIVFQYGTLLPEVIGDSKFEISIQGEKSPQKLIIPSSNHELIHDVRSGIVETGIEKCDFLGIDDMNKVILEMVVDSKLTLPCNITDVVPDKKTFNFNFRIMDLEPNKEINLEFKATYDGQPIIVEPANFILKTKQSQFPDFRAGEEKDWIDTCLHARMGLASLQKFYGITNFVGLTKPNTPNYDIAPIHYIVIGQGVDKIVEPTYEGGEYASLTFMSNELNASWDGESPINLWWNGNDSKCALYSESDLKIEIKNWTWDYPDDMRIIPQYIRFYMHAIKKQTFDALNKKLVESNEMVWPLSANEIGGVWYDEEDNHIVENECYEYFKGINSTHSEKWKRTTTKNVSYFPYWLRTNYFSFIEGKYQGVYVDAEGNLKSSRTTDSSKGFNWVFAI